MFRLIPVKPIAHNAAFEYNKLNGTPPRTEQPQEEQSTTRTEHGTGVYSAG